MLLRYKAARDEFPRSKLWDASCMRALSYSHGVTLNLLSLLVLGGCSDRGAQFWPVQGKVVYQDGQPLPGGTIELESKDNSTLTAVGTIAADGTFRLEEGALSGGYRVAIHAAEPIDPDELDDKTPPPLLDAKYEDIYQSGLEITIEPKANELTIEVERP
jgi:hypothetical protein